MDSLEEREQLSVALKHAYHFLKFRPRSNAEMREYLTKKEEKYSWSGHIKERILELLTEERLIDDKAFLEWYVHQRTTHKPRGARAILHELRRFHIDQDLIQSFFQDLNLPEEELALRALERRWPRFSSLEPQKRREKAYMFLANRGFSYPVIKNTIAKMEPRE